MAADKLAYYQRCGDNQKSGSALEDHMKKNTMSLFGTHTDPQMTLQKLREYTSNGNEAKHEELWKKLNIEAFIDRYVTSYYKSKAAQETPWPTAIKEQIVHTTNLYYKFIIRNEYVPDDGIPCADIVSWCSVPLDLVVKLGWVGFMRSSSSGGGRQSANDAKKVINDNKTEGKATNKKRRSSMGAPPEGVPPAEYHQRYGELNKDGTPAQKPGRKPGSVIVDGKVKMPTGSGKKVAANTAAISCSSSSSISNSTADMATEMASNEKMEQLEFAIAKQAALISELQKANADLKETQAGIDTRIQVKDAQFKAELSNRKNLAVMASSMATGGVDVQGLMTDVSPIKKARTDTEVNRE